MRGKLVVGNWKMNGGLASNVRLLERLVNDWQPAAGRSIAVCVPFPYLGQAQAALSGSPIAWGAQDVSAHDAGAYTGEVAATMLIDFGCRFVIVGHSERRQWHREGDADVAAKAGRALAAGVTPVVCVGETLAEREAGTTETIVLRQLNAVAARLGERIGAVVIAYEPVWAIGTGRTASPAEAQAVHRLVRKRLGRAHDAAGGGPPLYGGSGHADKAKAFLGGADIDGGLGGGAARQAGGIFGVVACLI